MPDDRRIPASSALAHPQRTRRTPPVGAGRRPRSARPRPRRDYVDRYTVGFEQLEERVQQYPPERVSAITGIPVADILKLTREYATTRPSVIRIGVAIERHTGGGIKEGLRGASTLPRTSRKT